MSKEVSEWPPNERDVVFKLLQNYDWHLETILLTGSEESVRAHSNRGRVSAKAVPSSVRA
jgi:hypothetical protein